MYTLYLSAWQQGHYACIKLIFNKPAIYVSKDFEHMAVMFFKTFKVIK